MRLLIILMSIVGLAQAEIPKERRLKKLSLHIKGEIPSLDEYKELNNISEDQISEYFLEKTDEYLNSKGHVNKMDLRLSQLFRLSLPNYIMPNSQNSLNTLFKRIAEDNLSWDSLLINKKYSLYTTGEMQFDFFTQSDFGFFGAILPKADRPRELNGIINKSNFTVDKTEEGSPVVYQEEHDFEGDNRVAGALTTSRFFNRYVNTAINKNRRRAAAVFRIFLCDDMEAAITDSSDRIDYILDFVFPNTEGMSQADVSSIGLTDSAHGQRPDCMACHYKLDPMGKTFGGSGKSLAPSAFKGALSYRTKGGDKVKIPADGIGEIASALVQQRDYKACQTQHFWKWFIGEDKYLSPQIQDELISKYEELNGKTNDFIKYLVNRKEFYNNDILSEESKLAFKAKKILKNCNQCHQEKGMPSFTDWPIESQNKNMKNWTDDISKSLGLHGTNRSMPPESHLWQPTDEDIEIINQWIKNGAPNESGEKQIP